MLAGAEPSEVTGAGHLRAGRLPHVASVGDPDP